jgi:Zinc finger, C3HC4 type (RING finger)
MERIRLFISKNSNDHNLTTSFHQIVIDQDNPNLSTNYSNNVEELFVPPAILESNTTIILALVIVGLLLIFGGVVGFRYLKRKRLRENRSNSSQNQVGAGTDLNNPQTNQLTVPAGGVIYIPTIRRVTNNIFQSSQYVQRNDEILHEHTIVIDSFPQYRTGIRTSHNYIPQNRTQQIYELPLDANNIPQIHDTNNQLPPKEDLNPDVRCVICWEQEANVIFVPCAHKCCCTKDGWYILNNKKTCPMCRNPIEGVINSTLKNAES